MRIKDKDAQIFVKQQRDGMCLVKLSRKMLLKYGDCYGPLDVHHLRTRGSGGDDVPENMITLCRKHHTMAGDWIIPREELEELLHDWFGYDFQ